MAEPTGDEKETLEINSSIKRLMDMKDTIDKLKNSQHYWELYCSAISTSIWTKQIKDRELQKMEACYRAALSETTKLVKDKEQELKNLKIEREKQLYEQGIQFRLKCTNYVNKFINAQQEYSSKNLTKEIKQYHEEYKKKESDLQIRKREFNDLERKCSLVCTDSKADIEEILKINIMLDNIIAESDNQLQEIGHAQHKLKNIEDQIKRKAKLLKDSHK